MSVRPIWKALRDALEMALRHQVTAGGLLFTFTISLVGVAAFVSANNLLFLLFAALLSTLLVSGFVSRLSLSGLELDFVLPEHISARARTSARILIRNSKSWMPSFSIHLAGSPDTGMSSVVYFPSIPRNATVEEGVEVLFTRRGIYRENSFQFSTRFPFGFTERRIRVRLRREILVYPSIGPQSGFEALLQALSGEIQAYYRGRGHDFYRIRPYEAFESARHVDWKATAHTGDLQVREFAQEQEHLIEMFLDLEVAPERLEWFEQAVDCCAFLVWHVSERGARIRFRTQDFDLTLPEEGDVYTILKYLAETSPLKGKAPPAPGDERSFKIVFTTIPDKFLEAGWTSARMLDTSAFGGAGATGTGAGENLHHRS